MRRVYSPLAVALLIRLAKLRGESLHLAPLLTLVCVFLEHVLSQSASVRVCCCTCVYACVCVHTSATGRTLPFVGGPFVVALLSPGMCGY